MLTKEIGSVPRPTNQDCRIQSCGVPYNSRANKCVLLGIQIMLHLTSPCWDLDRTKCNSDFLQTVVISPQQRPFGCCRHIPSHYTLDCGDSWEMWESSTSQDLSMCYYLMLRLTHSFQNTFDFYNLQFIRLIPDQRDRMRVQGSKFKLFQNKKQKTFVVYNSLLSTGHRNYTDF